MTDPDKLALLQTVRADIAAYENEIERCRRRIHEIESELPNLRQIESYLSKAAPRPAASAGTAIVCPSFDPETERVAVILPRRNPESVTHNEVVEAAVRLLEQSGPEAPLRPIDIARRIIPGYESQSDRRVFENRIYSAMKSRPGLFRRVKKGHWTLTKFGMPPLFDEDDGDDSELMQGTTGEANRVDMNPT